MEVSMPDEDTDQKVDDRSAARRVTGRKMTRELAEQILILRENTKMTQPEIASKLGLNQARVNEVVARYDG
jgi:predicted XRE-type DNA-binding protein